MSEQSYRVVNLKILLLSILVLLILPVLAACGDSTQTVTPAQSTPTAPAVTPTSNPDPTVTIEPTPTVKQQPVVVIPPATVTPLNNVGPTATPVATIPSGPIVTAPASTPVSSVPAITPPTPGEIATPAATPQNNATTVNANPPQVTTQPGSSQQYASSIIFYLKDGTLMANVPGEKTSRQVAAKVYSYLRDGKGRVVFLQQSGVEPNQTAQLMLGNLANGQVQVNKLDTRLFEALPADRQNEGLARVYGVDNRAMGEMAISPDGSQVVYTKANLGGPTFNGMSAQEKPTELWLANLDPANPAPKQLVPNDKDYIAQPLWSPDGNRIAFIRTTAFGTGAGYATSLWSVYKDGSRLAFLTGPDLGKVDGEAFSAHPVFNLRWAGPQALVFQATNQSKSPIFLHDLTLGRDFPEVIATDAAPEAVFCEGIGRYIYLKADPNGGPQPGAFSVGLTNPANQTGTVDKDAVELYGCAGNNLLYRTTKNEVVLAQLNQNGTVATGKRMPVEQGSDVQVMAKLAPGGKLAAVQAGKITRVLADTGQITELKSGSFKYETLILEWASDKVLVGLTFSTGQPYQILAANLAGEKVFKVLDEGNNLFFTNPDKTAKANF